METLNPNFWDCECENDFIHPKTESYCHLCGAHADEQPDSREHELQTLYYLKYPKP